MLDNIRKGTTVTVTVPNPQTATNEELLTALKKQNRSPVDDSLKVEYINSRKDDGRVCFGVSWSVI